MKKNTLKLKLILLAMCLFGALFVTSTASANYLPNVDVTTTVKNLYYNNYGKLLVTWDSISIPFGNDDGCKDKWMATTKFDTEELRLLAQFLKAAHLSERALTVRYYGCSGATTRPELVFVHF